MQPDDKEVYWVDGVGYQLNCAADGRPLCSENQPFTQGIPYMRPGVRVRDLLGEYAPSQSSVTSDQSSDETAMLRDRIREPGRSVYAIVTNDYVLGQMSVLYQRLA